MSDDRIQYDLLALDAMRGVIRTVLQRVQKRGIPGDHHFYISFQTQSSGVILSKRLRDRYPDEMTIVIQHQFWDLQVFDDRFEVKLSFNNVPEKLVIPFASIRRFHDPSVDFGFNLQVFDPATAPVAEVETSVETIDDGGAKGGNLPVPMIADHSAGGAGDTRPSVQEAIEPLAEEPEQKKTAEIVKLDAFRKK